MTLQPQHGYLVLADISGYTSYLAQVELDHAHEILTDLLEAIVAKFKALLTISKLEGDAVFGYVPETKVDRGETLLELLEGTYLAFHERTEAARRRTTCECRACKAIPSLELKFFVHHGDYMVQSISGIRELVGSDVNLVHRLMKNHVTETTGWRAYALFTQPSLGHLDLQLQELHTQPEAYEHLGEVQTYSLNLRPRYEAQLAARRVFLSAQGAHFSVSRTYPVSPSVLWDWINDPQKRAQWVPEPVTFVPVFQPQGRTGVGARTHCIHGKNVAMIETVLDWRPFDYFTVHQIIGPYSEEATFALTVISENETRLTVSETGHLTGLAALDRPITRFLLTKYHPTAKLLELLGEQIQAELARADNRPAA